MSTFRHRFRLVIDGATYEVVTNAWDMLDVDPNGRPMMQTMTMVHAACIRNELPVPHDLRKFIECLDDIDDLEAEVTQPTDPTVPALSDI